MQARIEEADIVRFERDEDEEQSAWVNVGAFAVRLTLDAQRLQIEAFALGNEGEALASMSVSRAETMAAGALCVDPFSSVAADSETRDRAAAREDNQRHTFTARS